MCNNLPQAQAIWISFPVNTELFKKKLIVEIAYLISAKIIEMDSIPNAYTKKKLRTQFFWLSILKSIFTNSIKIIVKFDLLV